jgi:hypothetical protein
MTRAQGLPRLQAAFLQRAPAGSIGPPAPVECTEALELWCRGSLLPEGTSGVNRRPLRSRLVVSAAGQPVAPGQLLA